MTNVTRPKSFGTDLTALGLVIDPSPHTSVRSPVIVQTIRRTREGRPHLWFSWSCLHRTWSPVGRGAEQFGKPATTAGGVRPYFVATCLAERSA